MVLFLGWYCNDPGGHNISQEKKIARSFLTTIEQFAGHVDDIVYQNIKLGRKIFIVIFVGSKKQCNMKDIIDHLKLSPSTATRQVEYLVKNKFILRETPSHNRRTVELKLNDMGKEVIQWFNGHLLKVVKLTLQDFSENELLIASKALRVISDNSGRLLLDQEK